MPAIGRAVPGLVKRCYGREIFGRVFANIVALALLWIEPP